MFFFFFFFFGRGSLRSHFCTTRGRGFHETSPSGTYRSLGLRVVRRQIFYYRLTFVSFDPRSSSSYNLRTACLNFFLLQPQPTRQSLPFGIIFRSRSNDSFSFERLNASFSATWSLADSHCCRGDISRGGAKTVNKTVSHLPQRIL